MGLFEKIFGKTPKRMPANNTPVDYKTLTAYAPVFTNNNGKLYESELVRSAIDVRALNISKLKVEFTGHGAEALKRRLKRPNNFQTWSQFLYRVSTILDVTNTCFIVPSFDKYGRICELYPILPNRTKMVGDTNDPWLAFEFRDGHYAQLPVWKVGVLTRHQYERDFFGETNEALRSTMALIDIQNQGIMEGVKSSATFRFMAQLDNFAMAGDLAKEAQRFTEESMNSDNGGLLLFPNTYKSIQQIKSSPFVIDAEQMNTIQKNVFNYFGVNEDVMQNKAYGNSWTAFYEGAIEPFAIQFSEVITDLFILCQELTGDASVMLTANRLQYMSNAEKLNVSSQLADRGILNRDEVREIWNLPPLPNGEGQEYVIRGEYKNANEQVNGSTEKEDKELEMEPTEQEEDEEPEGGKDNAGET